VSGFLLEFTPLKNGAGMTAFVVINVAVYKWTINLCPDTDLYKRTWKVKPSKIDWRGFQRE
jgi:hypothetical protein